MKLVSKRRAAPELLALNLAGTEGFQKLRVDERGRASFARLALVRIKFLLSALSFAKAAATE